MNKNTLGGFWKFHVVVVQNNVKEMYQKCAARAELLFLLIRPIVVFLPFSLLLPPSITRFFILFEQTININYREIRFEPWLNLYITLY